MLTQYARRVQKALTLFILLFCAASDTPEKGRCAIKQFRLLSRRNYFALQGQQLFTKTCCQSFQQIDGAHVLVVRWRVESNIERERWTRETLLLLNVKVLHKLYNKMIFLAFFTHEHWIIAAASTLKHIILQQQRGSTKYNKIIPAWRIPRTYSRTESHLVFFKKPNWLDAKSNIHMVN